MGEPALLLRPSAEVGRAALVMTRSRDTATPDTAVPVTTACNQRTYSAVLRPTDQSCLLTHQVQEHMCSQKAHNDCHEACTASKIACMSTSIIAEVEENILSLHIAARADDPQRA